MKKFIRRASLFLVVAFVAIQLVPYGREHTNPPVQAEPSWNAPRTRELAARACFDCHSNESRWPWYSNVAPASWLVQRDVDEGREQLNFSEWTRVFREAEEAAELAGEGEMPPWFYLPLHPEAKLSESERAELVAGLEATLGSERRSGERSGTKHGGGAAHDD